MGGCERRAGRGVVRGFRIWQERPRDNRPAQTQERNDFLFSQIITEGLSLAVRCFREARTQTDLRLDVQAPNGS